MELPGARTGVVSGGAPLRVFKHYLLGSTAPRPAGCGSDFDLRADNQAITWLKTNKNLNKMQAITWLKTNKNLNKMYVRCLDEIEDFPESASM